MEEQEQAADDGFFENFVSKLPPHLKDKNEETCYKEMFRVFDSAKKGYIQNEDMKSFYLKVKAEVGLTDEEVELLIKDMDKNDDGKVDFSEFYKFMLKE